MYAIRLISVSSYRKGLALKQLIPVYFIRFLARFPLFVMRCVGHLLGWVVWFLGLKDADTTRKNIALCFPALSAKEKKQLAKRSVCESTKTICELGIAWCWSDADIQRVIHRIENLELLHNAYAQGKGVIVCAPHLGNWEILGYYLGRNFPTTIMYLAPENPQLHDLMCRGRGRNDSELAQANRRGVLTVLKNLKRGLVAGILPDQVPENEESGVYSPFFGQPTFTMTLIPSLIQKTGCAVVFAYAKRVKGGFDIVFRAPDEQLTSTDIQTAVNALNESIERCVEDVVVQYQWEYKRFKKRPDGKTKFYDQLSY